MWMEILTDWQVFALIEHEEHEVKPWFSQYTQVWTLSPKYEESLRERLFESCFWSEAFMTVLVSSYYLFSIYTMNLYSSVYGNKIRSCRSCSPWVTKWYPYPQNITSLSPQIKRREAKNIFVSNLQDLTQSTVKKLHNFRILFSY